MRKTYNKLVRDSIPAIIRGDGRNCETVVMALDEYRQALLDKLVEEAWEAAQAEPDELVTELADVLEVLDALLVANGIQRDAVLETQRSRRAARGGFEQRLKLVWAE